MSIWGRRVVPVQLKNHEESNFGLASPSSPAPPPGWHRLQRKGWSVVDPQPQANMLGHTCRGSPSLPRSTPGGHRGCGLSQPLATPGTWVFVEPSGRFPGSGEGLIVGGVDCPLRDNRARLGQNAIVNMWASYMLP